MTSEQYNLILEDIKSWSITTAIFVLPFGLMALIDYVSNLDLGNWNAVIALVLGSLLKLAQKWSQYNAYPKQ